VEIEGQGWDLGREGEIYLRFGSTFNLVTKSLDASGNAELRLVFESTDVNGSFLDNPFEMSLDASGVQIVDGGRTATVGPGQPAPPRSPLEFLRTPVEMKVAPSGAVLDLRGPTGLSDLLAFLPAVARVEFPDEELYDGMRWETRFALPAPALGTAVETRVVNTFRGYQRVQDRYCAVVEQVLEGVQTGGTAEAFDSAGVDSMKVSVPLFNLTGKNTIYFDVNDLRLVHANLDMNLAMNIGGALGDAAGIVQLLGKSLLSPDREGLDDLQTGDGTEDLLDFNVSIVGAVSLLDSAALQSPQ
jgi:hypothetical protein